MKPQNVHISSQYQHYLTQPEQHSASYLVNAFKNKKAVIAEYLSKTFEYLEKSNPQVNAITRLEKNYALQRAHDLDKRPAAAHEILYGMPFIIKENIQKSGFSVACGSRMLQNYKGQFDATVVKQLEAAGAICIGTANMDEFAMGSSSEYSVHGPTLNPHDTRRVAGGSSSGPAAAQSMGYAPLCLGSDTGGSVRLPAAFCGVFGFKPTYGRVSRYGLVAFGSSLDQISPFSRSIEDLDLFLKVTGHSDPNDATTLSSSYSSLMGSYKLPNKRIGVPRKLISKIQSKEVISAFISLEESLKKQGVTFVDIELPSFEYALSTYYIIACSEASSNLARFDGIRYGHRAHETQSLEELYSQSRAEGFGPEVKLRIMLGTYALSAGYYQAYYGRAQQVRQLLGKEIAEIFTKVDFIYLPTAGSPAFKVGEKNQDPMAMYLTDIFTVLGNLVGCPAISLPAPVATGELPIGLQFMAPLQHDAQLLALSKLLEEMRLTRVTNVPFSEQG